MWSARDCESKNSSPHSEHFKRREFSAIVAMLEDEVVPGTSSFVLEILAWRDNLTAFRVSWRWYLPTECFLLAASYPCWCFRCLSRARRCVKRWAQSKQTNRCETCRDKCRFKARWDANTFSHLKSKSLKRGSASFRLLFVFRCGLLFNACVAGKWGCLGSVGEGGPSLSASSAALVMTSRSSFEKFFFGDALWSKLQRRRGRGATCNPTKHLQTYSYCLHYTSLKCECAKQNNVICTHKSEQWVGIHRQNV